MANTYFSIQIQTVFAVKYRKAMIQKEWKDQLMAVIGNLINEGDSKTLIENGTEDHVHCFFGFKPKNCISELMQAVKAKSSKWINEQGFLKERFEWQDGFGAFSYSYGQIDQVYKYILNQEQHHQKFSFKQEYLQMLKKAKVEFDERYIFHEPI